MSHPYHHAVSSSKVFGGHVEDYLAIHQWFDSTKIVVADQRHRAFRHHSDALGDLRATIGVDHIRNRDGVTVSVELIGTHHISEDFGGYTPFLAEWVETVAERPWMKLEPVSGKVGPGDLQPPVRRIY